MRECVQVADIVDGWCNMMKRAQGKVLDKGGFDWRMFSPGSGTCTGPPFKAGKLAGGDNGDGTSGKLSDGTRGPVNSCEAFFRGQCGSGPSGAGRNATLQKSAMMYGLGAGCTLVTEKCPTGAGIKNGTCSVSPDDKPLDFEQHLASFLTLRGPYAWLGWAWLGCAGAGSGAVPGAGNPGVPIPPTRKEMVYNMRGPRQLQCTYLEVIPAADP